MTFDRLTLLPGSATSIHEAGYLAHGCPDFLHELWRIRGGTVTTLDVHNNVRRSKRSTAPTTGSCLFIYTPRAPATVPIRLRRIFSEGRNGGRVEAERKSFHDPQRRNGLLLGRNMEAFFGWLGHRLPVVDGGDRTTGYERAMHAYTYIMCHGHGLIMQERYTLILVPIASCSYIGFTVLSGRLDRLIHGLAWLSFFPRRVVKSLFAINAAYIYIPRYTTPRGYLRPSLTSHPCD